MKKSRKLIDIEEIRQLRLSGEIWKSIGERYGYSVGRIYVLAKSRGYKDPEEITRFKRQSLTWYERKKAKVRNCKDCGSPITKNGITSLCRRCVPKGRSGYRAQKKGSESKWWKGDSAGYDAKHRWISRNVGRPKKCEECGTEKEDERYEWANISGDYRRDPEDYIRLCKPCHEKWDKRSIALNARNLGFKKEPRKLTNGKQNHRIMQ